MQAVVAEADLRMVEMKKAVYEFDRDIVRAAVNPVRQTNAMHMPMFLRRSEIPGTRHILKISSITVEHSPRQN